MAIGYSSVEDLCNAALREAGYPRPISEIYEGSRASRVAVEVYGAARDSLLQEQDWDFALRSAVLNSAGGGTMILDYDREYVWPSDALRIKQVYPGTITSPNYDPQPIRWTLGNDGTMVTPAKVIWTYSTVAAPKCIYIAQIINPLTWSAVFTRALIGRLARIFAFALRDDINVATARSRLADQTTAEVTEVGDGGTPNPELMMQAVRAASRG